MKIIKFMRNSFFLFFILLNCSMYSQIHNSQNAPYIGTWEYQNGNQIFRLIIWENSQPNPFDDLYYLIGRYEMVEKNNNSETIIYTSNSANNSNNGQNHNALNGVVDGGMYIGVFNEMHENGSGLLGDFEIINLASSEISFRVVKKVGININEIGTTTETDFVVPNNIVLIKKQ